MPASTWPPTENPRLKVMYAEVTPPSGPRISSATAASSRWYAGVSGAGRNRRRGTSAEAMGSHHASARARRRDGVCINDGLSSRLDLDVGLHRLRDEAPVVRRLVQRVLLLGRGLLVARVHDPRPQHDGADPRHARLVLAHRAHGLVVVARDDETLAVGR